MFVVDAGLLARARGILRGLPRVSFLVGGACTGKSTVARAIVEASGVALIDMDARIYGGFGYDATRHPAVKTWFSADNPLAWVMGLSDADFDALNRATNAEFLDLLADELAGRDPDARVLVDGGFTHPSVLLAAVPASRIVCLATDAATSRACWENDPDRAQMRVWIGKLPEPETLWARFLDHDRRMSETLVRESEDAGIPVVFRHPDRPVDAMVDAVRNHLGWA